MEKEEGGEVVGRKMERAVEEGSGEERVCVLWRSGEIEERRGEGRKGRRG